MLAAMRNRTLWRKNNVEFLMSLGIINLSLRCVKILEGKTLNTHQGA